MPPSPSVNDSVVTHLASPLKQEKLAQVMKPHTLVLCLLISLLEVTSIKSPHILN